MKVQEYADGVLKTASKEYPESVEPYVPYTLVRLTHLAEEAKSAKKFLFCGGPPVKSDITMDDVPLPVPLRKLTPQQAQRLHAILGIADELGELVENWINEVYHGEEDTANLLAEFGDLSWYSFLGMHSTGHSPQEILHLNQKKLLGVRYHGGYSHAKSEGRDVDAERAVFEAAAKE